MDTLLIAITVASLGAALALGVVSWRVSKEERRRAAARVAALSAAARDEEIAPRSVAIAPLPEPTPAGATARPWKPASVSEPESLDAFDREAARSEVPVRGGFLGADIPAREGTGRQRGLAAAAAVLAVVVGAFALARMGGGAEATESAGTAPAPLELLSLRHEREGATLSVAGLVRNPPAGTNVERVSAVVLLFDQQGTFVTSAKAPIDFVKLAAGDESPFVVKMPAPQAVARYRVSFRTDDGTLPHVDRRGESPAATPVALARP
ncbi:MAG: hypothetical protein AB7Q16_09220 [Vicinamibacterales bacterium]